MRKQMMAVLMAGMCAGAATLAQAEGLKFLPILDRDFKAAPTLALTAGGLKAPAGRDDVVAVYGLEFSMNCGLLQTPDNRIRTHVSVNHANEGGLKYTSVELSPRYTMPLGSGFSIGAGPALAWIKADLGQGDKDRFGYGAATGVAYRNGAYFSGVDLRYLNTERRDDVKLENWTLMAKVGVNF